MKGNYFIIGLVLSMVLIATPTMAASTKVSSENLNPISGISLEAWSLVKTWSTFMAGTGDEHMSEMVKVTNSGNYKFQLTRPPGTGFELYVYSSYSRRWHSTSNQMIINIPRGYYYRLRVESYLGSGAAKVQVFRQT